MDDTNIEKAQHDVDITPLLDVVFILLIFFIVTASFERESGIVINHPAPSTTGITEPPIVLEVTELGQYRLQSRPVNQHAISASVLRLKSENPQAAVTIRVHKKAKTEHVTKAIDELANADVEHPVVSLHRT